MENYNKNHEKEAVAFYRSDKIAVLSTISKKYEGTILRSYDERGSDERQYNFPTVSKKV